MTTTRLTKRQTWLIRDFEKVTLAGHAQSERIEARTLLEDHIKGLNEKIKTLRARDKKEKRLGLREDRLQTREIRLSLREDRLQATYAGKRYTAATPNGDDMPPIYEDTVS